MSRTDLGRGRTWGGQGRQGRAGRTGLGRAGMDWVGPGYIADRNPRHARPSNGNQSRTENRDGTK
jgi:hypothetical protein